MSKIFKIRPNINKANKQVNISIPKRDLPPEVKRLLGKDPSLIKVFKLKFEGYE